MVKFEKGSKSVTIGPKQMNSELLARPRQLSTLHLAAASGHCIFRVVLTSVSHQRALHEVRGSRLKDLTGLLAFVYSSRS